MSDADKLIAEYERVSKMIDALIVNIEVKLITHGKDGRNN